jgi:RNA polymerase sigma-70 factor (ECF subfamily)
MDSDTASEAGEGPLKESSRMKPYLERLYGYAVSLARDHHQAEDLVQECALRVLKAKNVPHDERAYRAWLFRILRNLFIDQARREKTAAAVVEEQYFARETEYWQGEERFISVMSVRLAMAKLPRAQREIITLIDFVGFSYAETAQLLDVPIGTVMSRISRARRMLLETIEPSNVHELPLRKKKGMS